MAEDLYKALHEDAQEIRLMTLARGVPEDELQATLSTTSLDKLPEYEALSYVWGDPIKTKPIKLDGQYFEVTENLEAALRRLRALDHDRVLWIDAICVNQVNLSERNSQVHLMRDVYSKCTRCIIWLGEEDETTAEGLKFLEFAATDSHLREWPRFTEMIGVDESQTAIAQSVQGILKKDPQCFEPFIRLMMRPWWYRMWTIQEFVLPKWLLIVCGGFIIEWDVIVRAQEMLLIHYDSCCAHHYKALSGHSMDFAVFWTNTIVLQLFRREWLKDGLMKYDLLNFLRCFRGRSTSDPKDKVYGILGLLSRHHRTGITPSYESDIRAAYLQTVENDIGKSGTLNMLGHVEDREENRNLHNLPSWAPDWSVPIKWWDNQAPRIVRASMGLYKACSSFNFQGCFHDEKFLSTRGVKWDTILHVGRLIEDENSFTIAVEMRDWITANLPSHAIPLDDASFQRILLNDSYTEQSAFALVFRATNQHYEDCQVWWDTQNEGQGLRELPKEKWKAFVNVESTVSTNLLLRRFFLTAKGSMGIGPPRMKAGDEVWVLRGGKVPHILRPSEEIFSLPDVNVVDQPCHTLVGEAYVDGIMDGEAAAVLEKDETSTGVFLF